MAARCTVDLISIGEDDDVSPAAGVGSRPGAPADTAFDADVDGIAHSMPLAAAAHTTMLPVREDTASQPLQRTSSLDGSGQALWSAPQAPSASRREMMKQKATHMASVLAHRGSRSKQAAVGFLNKLSRTPPYLCARCPCLALCGQSRSAGCTRALLARTRMCCYRVFELG
jgi:hypothetical protein